MDGPTLKPKKIMSTRGYTYDEQEYHAGTARRLHRRRPTSSPSSWST
jgi:hypothetical protein